MAEETLVKEPLTAEMIEAGKQLTSRLDRTDFEVLSSLWLFTSETNQWRLVLASPQLDREGPKKAYTRIQAVLSQRPNEVAGLNLQNITALSPDDPLIRLLRTAIRTGRGLSGIRFSRNRINDTFIEDAYIYRLL